MPITEDDIQAAEAADLEGVVSVKHADKTVTYDAQARAKGIERAKRRLRKTPLVSLVAPKGYD